MAAEGGFKMPKDFEEFKALAIKVGSKAKEQFLYLKEQGLMSYSKEYLKDMVKPIEYDKLKDKELMQKIVLVQSDDLDQGFILGVAATVWLEVLGGLFNFLFGASVAWVVFEILYALLVGYVLYFMVCKSPIAKHAKYAFYVFVVYTILNVLETMSSFIFVLPAIFIGAKTVACFVCCAYSYKIMKRKAGSTALGDDEMVAH